MATFRFSPQCYLVTICFAINLFPVNIFAAVEKNAKSEPYFISEESPGFSPKAVELFKDEVQSQGTRKVPGYFRWVPRGGMQSTLGAQCDGFQLEKNLLAKKISLPEFQKKVSDYFRNCGNWLSRRAPTPFAALVKEKLISYDYKMAAKSRELVLKAPEGFVYRGIFVESPNPNPRPLVIVQCGIYCNSSATSLAKLLMVFHDEAHFHVLLLGSITGSDYQKENLIFSAGGFDEGRKLFRWAQFLKSDRFDLKNKISGVHVVAYSHGSHSGLYASVINSFNKLKDRNSYIQSFFLGCSPIDLKTSSQFAYRDSFMGRVVYYLFKTQLLDVISSVPVIRDLTAGRGDFPGREAIIHFVSKAALESYKKWVGNPLYTYEPFRNVQIQDQDKFWDANNFSHFAHLGDGPVFMWSSLDDPVVNTEDNLQSFLRDQKPESTAFQGIVTPRGGHCNFESMYGWKNAAVIMKSHILQNDESFDGQYKIKRYPIPYLVKKLAKPKNVIGFEWRYAFDKGRVELVSKELTKRWVSSGQGRVNSSGAYQDVVRERVSIVEFEKLPWPSHMKTKPLNEVQAEKITRWMNAHYRVLGDPKSEPSELAYSIY